MLRSGLEAYKPMPFNYKQMLDVVCRVKPVALLTAVCNECFRRKHCTATSDTYVLLTLPVRRLITWQNLCLFLNSVKHPLKRGYLFHYYIY